MYSRFVALRIRPAGREIRKATAATGLPVHWLLAEWPADQDEPVQFWLSNLPETTPWPVPVRTAKLRWRIENDYPEMKQALGLPHFEDRTWPGRHNHAILVSVALTPTVLPLILASAPPFTAGVKAISGLL